tara:strand:+ start:125 stop:511 length:387 start_codon:yes stop_codon:yes gene_type:complete
MSIIRKTKTVNLILKEFSQNDKAISTTKLIDKFKTNMDRTTVYRILDRLEESNILHSFIDNDGLKRYAKNTDNYNSSSDDQLHPHFLCEECGISSCLPIKLPIPNLSEYIIKSAEYLLKGHCKNCPAK